MLTDQQRDDLRKQLNAMRTALEDRFEGVRREAQPVSLDQAVGRLTRVDMLQRQQFAADQQDRLEAELRQVNAAIARLERNELGICLHGKVAIPYPRLTSRPTTMLCYDCQEALESKR